MFPFRSKKNDKKSATSKWINYGVGAFVIYILVTNYMHSNTQVQPTTTQQPNPAENTTENTSATSAVSNAVSSLGDFSVLKGKLLPEYTIKLSSADVKQGEGEPVVCGQTATIKYSSFTEDKKEIEKDQKLTFVIGEKKILPALDKAVMGMKKGGIRTIKSPGRMAYGSEGFARVDVPAMANIDFEVELLDITPAIVDASAYRAIGAGDSELGHTCGSEVKMHITIWDIEGKKIYSSMENNEGKPIEFTIGKSQVFVGLEVGAMGMITETRRNLVVPPSVQKTLKGNPNKVDFNFPKNQTVLVDIVSIP